MTRKPAACISAGTVWASLSGNRDAPTTAMVMDCSRMVFVPLTGGTLAAGALPGPPVGDRRHPRPGQDMAFLVPGDQLSRVRIQVVLAVGRDVVPVGAVRAKRDVHRGAVRVDEFE